MNCRLNFSRDGTLYGLIFEGNGGGTIVIFDSTTDKIIWKINNVGKDCFAFSPDSKFIAAIHNGISIYDISSKVEVWNFKPNFETINSFCFSPDGLKFVAVGEYETDWDFNDPDMTSLALWDLKSGKNLWEWRCGLYEKVIFSPNGETLFTIGTAAVNRNETAKINSIDLTTEELEEIFREKNGLRFWDLDITPDGHALICCGMYYYYESEISPIVLVDLSSVTKKIEKRGAYYKTKNELRRLEGHVGSVTAVSLAPTGKITASASSDGTVRIWDLASAKQLHSIKIFTEDLKFSPDGTHLVLVNEGKLHFYDVKSWNKAKMVKIK
ncbi:WD40 repeat domain-containing protein [Candidatus Lokiarchaeum ossiferum]|uniref:WD40 repeat domain-containing protein n=1 Tax=Candidatus Lokiarchaeum ossiferum TaxID=2951803 RepID=UPI00352C6B6A